MINRKSSENMPWSDLASSLNKSHLENLDQIRKSIKQKNYKR